MQIMVDGDSSVLCDGFIRSDSSLSRMITPFSLTLSDFSFVPVS